jgi:hypothetical protein
MNPQSAQATPWFHHFWPWFIVLLLGVSVIASLYTVSLAYQLGDLESPKGAPRSELGAESSAAPNAAPRPSDH